MICTKVTRTVIPLILSFVFVFSSILPAKADTIQAHGTVSTSYGSYTWSAQQAASTLPITVSLPYVGISFAYNSGTSFSIDYSLKNQYSGIVTITVTGNNTWSVDNVNILTSGCNLDSLPSDHAQYKTSHSFNLRLKNSDKFSFVIYGAGTTVFLGSTSVSVAYNMSVDNLEQQIDATLDLYLPGMSTSLSGLGYDSNENTSLTADTLAYDIAIIKNYIDGIEGQLSANNHYIDQIEGYIDDLESSLTTLITNQIYLKAPVWQYGAMIWAWNNGARYTGYYLERGLVAFDYSSKSSVTSYTDAIRIRIPANTTMRLYLMSGEDISNSIRYLYNGTSTTNTLDRIQSDTGYPAYKYIFTFTNNNSTATAFDLVIDRDCTLFPLFFGRANNIPDDVQQLYGLDLYNTYTSLLQQIVNGIGNISQQQIIENNTNINNYNNYQTQINNVENNYYNQFNNHETTIENNNTFNFDGLSSDGVTVYHDMFTNAFNISLVKWPIMIILLGLVIIIILG